MVKEKYYLILGIIVLLGIIFISNSIQHPNNKIAEKGFLEGKISIGPLCPVERIPPSPRCQPTEATYKAWQVAVWTADKKTKIVQIQPNLNGSYKIELPAESYIVNFEKRHLFSKNLPASINIKPHETTTLNISIDTGIR